VETESLASKTCNYSGRGSTIAEIAKHCSVHTCANGLTKTITNDPRSANEIRAIIEDTETKTKPLRRTLCCLDCILLNATICNAIILCRITTTIHLSPETWP
jgi:hypothetical protein